MSGNKYRDKSSFYFFILERRRTRPPRDAPSDERTFEPLDHVMSTRPREHARDAFENADVADWRRVTK